MCAIEIGISNCATLVLRPNVQPLSRLLVKIGIILVVFGITMAFLLGLSIGLIFAATWVFGDSVDDPLTGIPDRLTVGIGYMAAFAFHTWLIALAGGVGAVMLGLTLKVVALSAGYLRRH